MYSNFIKLSNNEKRKCYRIKVLFALRYEKNKNKNDPSRFLSTVRLGIQEYMYERTDKGISCD